MKKSIFFISILSILLILLLVLVFEAGKQTSLIMTALAAAIDLAILSLIVPPAVASVKVSTSGISFKARRAHPDYPRNGLHRCIADYCWHAFRLPK